MSGVWKSRQASLRLLPTRATTTRRLRLSNDLNGSSPMPNELPAPPKSGAAWRVTIQWVSCDQPYAENRTFISQTGCHERDGKSVAGGLEFFAGTLASVMKAVIATGLCVPTCKRA